MPFTKEPFFYTQYKIAREYILTGYQFVFYLHFTAFIAEYLP